MKKVKIMKILVRDKKKRKGPEEQERMKMAETINVLVANRTLVILPYTPTLRPSMMAKYCNLYLRLLKRSLRKKTEPILNKILNNLKYS